ncbi:ATP-binding protein [Cupriavidus sp. L7L]|uniref:ATP-binding protein n=1 Tax=Cupriavidus sp. L7L TaxID=2546443 RepID=UPI001055D7AA|nr:ATP-binding protein [Cupriavidus sp. L7L]TDF60168.1 HAMP domain-containing histidine kinase [Cupriavidus sp. L7L]
MTTAAAVPPSSPSSRLPDLPFLSPLPAASSPRHGQVTLRRLFWLRWALLSGQALTLLACDPIAGIRLPYGPLMVVLGLQALFNLITALRLRQHTRRNTAPGEAELMGQLLVDLTALSAILFYTGGATNPFVSFYLPGLAIAAAILPWRQVLALAVYALACYTVLLFEYVPLDLHNPDNAVNYHLAGMWLNFVASAVMIAMFVARLSGVLRQREAQLNLAREQLLREARVEDLNGQAAAVAHEIGTPLATLAVIAGELRADASDAALGATPIRSYLPDLQTVEQQLALCRTTLARLREDSATLAPQRLDAWLPAFAERWQLRHPNASLQASATPGAGAQPVETARVGQILTILLDNAARAQQNAGRSSRPLQLEIAMEPGHVAPWLSFRVADHGDGIPEALRGQLGEMPVASQHGGQGIGLYLAQSGARQMGGELGWRDRSGGGTVAELRLPALSTLSAPRARSAS